MSIVHVPGGSLLQKAPQDGAPGCYSGGSSTRNEFPVRIDPYI